MGIVLAGSMKSVRGSTTGMDGMAEGKTVMAWVVRQAAVASIAGLAACGLVRWDKGLGAGAHGDGCRTR